MDKNLKKFMDTPTRSRAQILDEHQVEVQTPDGEIFTMWSDLAKYDSDEYKNYVLHLIEFIFDRNFSDDKEKMINRISWEFMRNAVPSMGVGHGNRQGERERIGKRIKEFLLNNALIITMAVAVIYIAIKNPNFIRTASVINILSQTAAYLPAALGIGGCIVLTGTDLSAGIVDVNDKLWYEDDFVSNAYIKTGEPEEGKEAYDPNNAKPIGIDVIPTGIDNLVYDQKQSIIFTAKSGESVPHSVGKYEWWRAVVCEWDAEAGNYRIISLDRNVSATAVKQPLIPENGFVLMDCGANDAAIANLAVGMPVWLYDIDLAAGTRGEKARIRANTPDEEATAYDPAFTGSQLAAPAFTDAVGGILNTPAEGTTVNWSAVAGADEYVFALSESAINDDGAVLITRKTVTGTAYTIPADMLSVGYTTPFRCRPGWG